MEQPTPAEEARGHRSHREVRPHVRARALAITAAFHEAQLQPSCGLQALVRRKAPPHERIMSTPSTGLRVGVLAWTFADGGLQRLLTVYIRRHPDRWRRIIGPRADLFADLIAGGPVTSSDLARFVAEDLEGGQGALLPDWRRRLRALVCDAGFGAVQDLALEAPLAAASDVCRRAGLTTDRAFCLAFDLLALGSRLIWATGHATGPEVERSRIHHLAELQSRAGSYATRAHRLERARCIAAGRGTVAGRSMSLAGQYGLCDEPWEVKA